MAPDILSIARRALGRLPAAPGHGDGPTGPHDRTPPAAGGGQSAEELLRLLPPQKFSASIGREEAKAGLAALTPKIRWHHYYDLGNGVTTIAHDDERHLRKAHSLKRLAAILGDLVPYVTRRGTAKGLSVLDLACAEGQHSIEMAAAGATVLGIEGRQLYVDRARFIARTFGFDNAVFRQGDVRDICAGSVGIHDLVLCSGILYHIEAERFLPTLRRIAEVTGDTLVLYTHTGNAEAQAKWHLTGPETIDGGYRGYFFREHPEGIDEDRKLGRMRSSLDNDLSFWPEEASLIRALQEVGFAFVSKMMHPYIFGDATRGFRPLLICRKAAG